MVCRRRPCPIKLRRKMLHVFTKYIPICRLQSVQILNRFFVQALWNMLFKFLFQFPIIGNNLRALHLFGVWILLHVVHVRSLHNFWLWHLFGRQDFWFELIRVLWFLFDKRNLSTRNFLLLQLCIWRNEGVFGLSLFLTAIKFVCLVERSGRKGFLDFEKLRLDVGALTLQKMKGVLLSFNRRRNVRFSHWLHEVNIANTFITQNKWMFSCFARNVLCLESLFLIDLLEFNFMFH